MCYLNRPARRARRQTRRGGFFYRVTTNQELEALRESEARSRIVMETVADAVVTIDESSTILYVNRAAERIFGYAPDGGGAPLTSL